MNLEIRKKWKNQQSFIRLLIFTFIGAPIQFLISFPFIWQAVIIPIDLTKKQNLPPLFDSPEFIALYFVTTLVYSISTSLSFPQKRIVSPLNIQILTWGLFMLLIPLAIVESTPYNLTLENIAVLGVYLAIITLGFGIAQTILVKFVIGMSGTKQDIIQNTLKINTDFKNIKKILQSSEFRDLFFFKEPIQYRGRKDFYFLKSTFDPSERILIALCPESENSNSSLLSIVSFKSKFYTIEQNKSIRQRHNMTTNEIKMQITEKFNNASFTEDLENDLSEFIQNKALGITYNKLEQLRGLSWFHKITLVGLGILFVVISYLRYIDSLSQDSFITILIFIGIAVIVDLIPRFTRTTTELDY